MSTTKKHTATTITTLSIGEIVFELPTGKVAEAYSTLTYLASLRAYKSEYAGFHPDASLIGSVLVESATPALKIEIMPEIRMTEAEWITHRDESHARFVAERASAAATKEAGK